MATCSRSVFPSKVIKHVVTETENFDDTAPVPDSMQLSSSMKKSHLGDSTIVEIELNHDTQSVSEVDVLRGRELIKRYSSASSSPNKYGSICLVQQVFQDFGMFGIVKETGVDDEGLLEFRDKYFSYPLYCDKSYAFYQALGDRKVSLSLLLNPISLVSMACSAYERITTKKISGNVGKGEGLVQGGIIIFGADGKPKYAYEEETGHDLPVKDILAAVYAVRREAMTNNKKTDEE